MSKTQIAGKSDYKGTITPTAINVTGHCGPNARGEGSPVRNEHHLVAGHPLITQEKMFHISSNYDDGIQRPEHQRICRADGLGYDRRWPQKAGHDQHVWVKIVQDKN